MNGFALRLRHKLAADARISRMSEHADKNSAYRDTENMTRKSPYTMLISVEFELSACVTAKAVFIRV